MRNYIKGILGESEDGDEPKKKSKSEDSGKSDKKEKSDSKGDSEDSGDSLEKSGSDSPSDSGKDAAGDGELADDRINELASMWQNGNKGSVAEQFLGMDNETAVHLVFAIGKSDALELARMVDEMQEQREGEGEFGAEGPGEGSSAGFRYDQDQGQGPESETGAPGMGGDLGGDLGAPMPQDNTISQILGRKSEITQ